MHDQNIPSSSAVSTDQAFSLPPVGGSPSSDLKTTTPGSFANRGRIAPGAEGAYTYSSPDTPNMPPASEKTAWDFLPEGWSTSKEFPNRSTKEPPPSDPFFAKGWCYFVDSAGGFRRVNHPEGFVPITQLEHARLGIITPQMLRVAEREPHLSAIQIRDEVAAGRMVIPANINHLKKRLDPMCIGRASKTKVNANLGASPVSSDIAEEIEKVDWALKFQADTLMDLSTGGDLNATRAAFCSHSTAPIGTVPIYSMIIGRKIEDLDWPMIEAELINQAEQGVDYFTIHAGVQKAHLPLVRNRLIGIVSRGGSLLAKWMLVHNAENIDVHALGR